MTPLHETAPKLRPAWARIVLATLLALGTLACAGPSGGPSFRPATPPAPDQALIYIYRTQSLGGIAAFDLELDSQGVGELADGQYLSFTLAPGRHVLSAKLRFFGLFPRAWNQLEFVAAPGETVYIATWANYKQHDDPGASVRADAGGGATGSIGVFMSRRDGVVAALELPAMRRAAGH